MCPSLFGASDESPTAGGLSKSERKERRKTNFDASTSRKSVFTAGGKANVFNSPIAEADETIRTENATPIAAHDLTQNSTDWSQYVN